ncbi:MAG TPA: hypothetical protein VKD91_06480 [Pyrinomonadaceae bacterium]|nr:hypothetical protein [Pyrinomonadaceae bacterium]
MKSRRLLIVPVLLLAVCAGSAQTSKSKTADADRAWPGFWRQFTAAVNKKDRTTLRKMMADNFADDSGGLNATEWLNFIEKNARQGSWRDLQKSFARGTVVNNQWRNKGVPTRITKDKFYYFEFRQDNKWYFAGVVGD